MAMRVRRQRVFKVTLQGTQGWSEPAGSRSLYEFQHDLSVRNPGKAIRVTEFYMGGAKSRTAPEDDEDLME